MRIEHQLLHPYWIEPEENYYVLKKQVPEIKTRKGQDGKKEKYETGDMVDKNVWYPVTLFGAVEKAYRMKMLDMDKGEKKDLAVVIAEFHNICESLKSLECVTTKKKK